MPDGASSEKLVTFRFHALVTVDESGEPYGEASTDPSASEPDGYLEKGFSAVVRHGYRVVQVSFEVEVPESELLSTIKIVRSRRAVEEPQQLPESVIIDARPESEPDERLPLGYEPSSTEEAFADVASGVEEFDQYTDEDGSWSADSRPKPPVLPKKNCDLQEDQGFDLDVSFLGEE